MNLIILFSLLLSSFVLGEPPLPSPYGRLVLNLPKMRSEESKRIVDQRLLDRVADIISQGGDGSEEPQENEGSGLLDSELFERIARIISQNEAQQDEQRDQTPNGSGTGNGDSASERNLPNNEDSSYGAPSPFISATYGPPHPQARRLAAKGIEIIGRPEPARRIASFDLSDYEDGQSSNNVLGGNSYEAPIRMMFYSNQNSNRDSYFSPPRRNSGYSGSGGGVGSPVQIGQRIRFVSDPQSADSIAAFDIPDDSTQPQVQVNGGYNN